MTRTTLDLDGDVAEALREIAARSGASFEKTVNEVLRAGLIEPPPRRPARPYRFEPASLGGALPEIDLDKALQLSDTLGDEMFEACPPRQVRPSLR